MYMKFLKPVLLSSLTLALACNAFADGEFGKISATKMAEINEKVTVVLDTTYGEEYGISLDLNCSKHLEFDTIYCAAAFSTGGGQLGIWAIRYSGGKIKVLDRSGE